MQRQEDRGLGPSTAMRNLGALDEDVRHNELATLAKGTKLQPMSGFSMKAFAG